MPSTCLWCCVTPRGTIAGEQRARPASDRTRSNRTSIDISPCERATEESGGSEKDVKSRRVLVLGRHALFAQGVYDLLERESDLEVLGLRPISAEGVARVEASEPDVIVIVEEDPAHAEVARHVRQAYPGLPVVRVALRDGKGRVHESEEAVATRADLLDAIRRLSG